MGENKIIITCPRWYSDESGEYWFADLCEDKDGTLQMVGGIGSFYCTDENGMRPPRDEQERDIADRYIFIEDIAEAGVEHGASW